MARALRSGWIHAVAAISGAVMLGAGVARLVDSIDPLGMLMGVLGFLVLGWVVFDRRRFRRGTPESEIDGGRTIE